MAMKMRRASKALAAVVFTAALYPTHAAARIQKDGLCAPLRAFVGSVKKGETRKIEFHTSWGQGFKGSPTNTFAEKRCIDNGYAPAKAACDRLMADGQIEFSGNDAVRAIACLSPDTHFADSLQLDRIDVQFSYGTEQRGSIVTVIFTQDSELGGMVLKISADGY